MASKTRVLIIDDAVVIRRLVSDVLNSDPDLEVVGTAVNGRIGLEKIAQLRPDLVTLDIEMPEMNGLETLAAIRKSWPRLPVIMFSTLTARGAAATLDALSLGASDYVTKPANMGSVAEGMQRVREDLIPKIKALCGRPSPSLAKEQAPASAAPRRATRRSPAQRIEVLAIGTSTGGPNALAEVLPELPAEFPVPILIVQHMPPVFTRSLAERLDARCQVSVIEAAGGETPRAGHAYLAPGGFHLKAVRSSGEIRLALDSGPQENSCRPAVDVLFRSVADLYGAATLAVVMTGMGKDGLNGSEAIWNAGGTILAQDEATSVVWGMPGFVARAGLAEQVLPIGSIAAQIIERVRHCRALTAAASRTVV